MGRGKQASVNRNDSGEFSALFEDSDLGVIICDKKGKILEVNTQFAEHLGLKKDDIVNKFISDFIKKSYAKTIDQVLDLSKEQGISSDKQIIKLLPYNAKAELTAKIVARTISKKPVQLLITLKFQDTYNSGDLGMNNLFLNISNNLSEGIYRGIPKRGLIYVNISFAKLFGYDSESEVVKIPPGEFIATEYDKYLIKDKLISEGHVKNEVVQFKKKDGSIFWGLINCSYSENEKGQMYYDGAIIDISEQKKSEELLRTKNQELKKINAQMDRFLYSASHDIRSPMTSIMGLVNILRMEIDQSKHSYLDKIDSSLKKLDYFIQEVMQFSKNARTRLSSERIDFKVLINKTWEKINGPNSRVDLIVKVPREPYYFFSDSDRLQTIFSNILKNSIQYTDPNILTPKIEVIVNAEVEISHISIIDNGIGIEEEYIENVCDMFFRANPNSKGSGMGLYIVKETLNRMKGELELTSKPHEGTSVLITIPNDSKGRLISKKMQLSKGKNYVVTSR